MFRRIWSWFFGSGNNTHLYQPKYRLIYSYFDGTKVVKADPMVLYTKIMDIAPSLSIDFKVSLSASKDANKAYHSSISTLRDVFKVKPLEEGGLGEIEVMELFDDFMEYQNTVKKNMNPYRMPPTATSASFDSTSVENQPTKSTLESGSTENGQSFAGQVPSPLPSTSQ